ncbi:hypothetical protein [Mesorhizobium sp. WSM3859]|uniref:hypothetical protein n=1 Tax=Mesorhizobium sp. WSM3859 TaxID=2029402 RepID=UPI0011409B01|nr:hypothetical protein [Mesorhizobium sp. WSM3859]
MAAGRRAPHSSYRLSQAIRVASADAVTRGDSGMKTMKSSADFETAWKATPKAMQVSMMKECNDAAMSKPHAQFCAQLFALDHHS